MTDYQHVQWYPWLVLGGMFTAAVLLSLRERRA